MLNGQILFILFSVGEFFSALTLDSWQGSLQWGRARCPEGDYDSGEISRKLD